MVTSVLVADATETRCESLCGHLTRAGYVTICCRTGAEAVRAVRDGDTSIAVVDWDLPDLGGEAFLAAVRHYDVPVLIMSSHGDPDDRVHGLELGAADFVTKPCSLREVVLRVGAVLRRGQRHRVSAVCSFGSGRLVLDQSRHEATVANRPVHLTPGEWSVLVTLTRCPGRVFSRHELTAWNTHHDDCPCERTVDTHVMNLRHKLGDAPPRFHVIETVPGAGYRLGLAQDTSPRYVDAPA